MRVPSISYKALLFILLTLSALTPTLPAVAQGDGPTTPANENANQALYLPLAMTSVETSQPVANPLSVSVSADSSQSVTQTIPIEGGSIMVTATNGIRYTLIFPADALVSEEEIVMTPLSAVDGIPLSGGMLAGIHLAPDGLRLVQPATLIIEGAPGAPDGLQLVGFGFAEQGKEFHLRLATTNENRVIVKLMHFSGYGVTAGTPQEIQQQATTHVPTADGDQMAQNSAADLGTLEDMQRWFNKILQLDMLPGRDGNSPALSQAIKFFQEWLDFAKEMKLENELATEIETGWKHILLGLAHAEEVAWVACRDGDASQVVKTIRWARYTRMLPAEPRRVWLSDNYVYNTVPEWVKKCANFELDFDATLVREVPGVPFVGQDHDAHLRAENIAVQFDTNAKLVAPSQSALVYDSFNLAGSLPGCQSTTQKSNGTFNLLDARINLNYDWGETPKLGFKFNPGEATESITHYCPANVQVHIEPHFWKTGFWRLHWPELRLEQGYFEFNNWNFVGKSLYAELIVERPVREDTAYFSGTTWMVLAHAPQK